MGFFGSSDNSDRAADLAQQQIELQQAELEQKRQNLYKTKLDIIKGQGAQSFVPDKTAGVANTSGGTVMGAVNGAFGKIIEQSNKITGMLKR